MIPNSDITAEIFVFVLGIKKTGTGTTGGLSAEITAGIVAGCVFILDAFWLDAFSSSS